MHRACAYIIVGGALAGTLGGRGCTTREDVSQGVGSPAPVAWRSQEAASGLSVPQFVAARINGGDLATVRDMCLSLGVREGGSFAPPGMPVEYARGPFSAVVLPIEIDGRPGRGSVSGLGAERAQGGGPDAIVRIGDPAQWDWRLLAFVDTSGGWKFVGSIDLPQHRFEEPMPESVMIGPGKAWLVVKSRDGGEGAGFSEALTTWYEVQSDRLVEVLRVPAGGYRSDGRLPFDVTYSSEIIDRFLTPQSRAAVRVRYEVVYLNARQEALPGLKELFRKSAVVTYLQDARTGQFVLDRSTSPFSAGELENLLSATPDDFLRANTGSLQALTRTGDARKRQWVGRLLLECQECAEKTALSEDLDAAHGG